MTTPIARWREPVDRLLLKPAGSVWTWLVGRHVPWATLHVLTFTAVASLLALGVQDRPLVQVDQVMPKAAAARVRFRAVDQEKTLRRKIDARDREPAYYVADAAYLKQLREKLIDLGRLGADPSIPTVDKISPETRESLGLTPEALEELRRFVAEQGPRGWESLTDQFLERLANLPVLDAARAQAERDPTQRAFQIVIQHPTLGPLERFDSLLISAAEDRATLRERVYDRANTFPPATRPCIAAVVMQDPRPFYLYDEEETRARRQARYDQEPAVEMTYEPNDLLVPAGKKLSRLDLELLAAERRAYFESLGLWRVYLVQPATVGMFFVVSMGVWTYALRYNSRLGVNLMRGTALTLLMLLGQALAVTGTGLMPQLIYATGTFPTLLTAIVLAVAYDQRFALAVGAIHALIVLLTLDQPMGFGLVLLTGVGTAVGMLPDVRTRSTVVLVGLWSGLAMGAVTLLVGLAGRPLQIEGELLRIGFDAVLAAATGFGTGLVVQGLLPAIEKLFKVTTSMTLKDLNDATHPLLRRLAQEALGTYQHSLRLADMAEAAAEAVGANSLLCRVGAMYHDIGKINKPNYFAENQAGGPNRHDKLAPMASVQIITGHVRDGVQMARQYRLPRVIRHFIESHHGTTLVEYFYHAARKRHEAGSGPAPNEADYRYPGPKPRTREAAILMLCDGAESAARSLEDPSAQRLEALVHEMATKRLMDGQFDDCNLTLQELNKIERSITKTLGAIYHRRVRYPSDRGGQPQPAPSPTTVAGPQFPKAQDRPAVSAV